MVKGSDGSEIRWARVSVNMQLLTGLSGVPVLSEMVLN